MVIPIHLIGHLIAQEVETAEKGSTTKSVKCERCGKDYTYAYSRTGWGRGTNFFFGSGGDKVAFDNAQAHLAKALEKGCEPVPCPACGWYQEDMVRRARRLRYRWMNGMAFPLFLVSIPTGLVGLISYGIMAKHGAAVPIIPVLILGLAGLAALLAPGFPILKYCLCRNYNPNYDTHERVVTKGWLVE